MAEIQRNDQTQKQTAEISPRFADQKAGNVGIAQEEIVFAGPTKDILIVNTHATQALYLCLPKLPSGFASQANEFPIPANGGSVAVQFRASSLLLRGEGANTTYRILATLE